MCDFTLGSTWKVTYVTHYLETYQLSPATCFSNVNNLCQLVQTQKNKRSFRLDVAWNVSIHKMQTWVAFLGFFLN